MTDKGVALLRFLKDAATLRRKRVPSYGSGDKIVWLGDVPRDRPECRSACLTDNPGEFPDIWLEVRKTRMPTRPPFPTVTEDWVRPQDMEQYDHEPELLPEITVVVERTVPDPDAPPDQGRTVLEKAPELRTLKDHPEVEDAWLEYLVNQWEPWLQEMRRWQEVQRVYEDVDSMRRRLEDSEERYELLLAVGLLQWRDSTGATVKRHLLTGLAEIMLNAPRGILTVVPAASFKGFRIELDMLESHDQPRIGGSGLQERLEELDIQAACDTSSLGEILRGIANRASPNAQVDEKALIPASRADETFRVAYAPALVLRERRPTAYEELIGRFLKVFDGDTPTATTTPWERFLREGAPSSNPADAADGQPTPDVGLGELPSRLLFPLPTNDEQRRIADRLRAQPYVLVKGPPGTGKSLTIANLICHLLASGERVLVTAHAPKALTVLRGLLPDGIRDLCVTALGSSREDQRLLEEGVRGILREKDKYSEPKWAQARMEGLEHELRQLQNELAQTERCLRECREAETYPHSLPGGYEGTAASIARQLEQQREMFGWFPSLFDQTPFPLQPDDVRLLGEVHAQLTEDYLQELRLETGVFSLPDADDFKRAAGELEAAEIAAERAVRGAAKEKVDFLQDSSTEALERSHASLSSLEKHAALASRLLGGLAEEILKDLLIGYEERWNRLAQDVAPLLKIADALREQLGTARVELPSDVDHTRLLADARRRLEHFENGGRRGFSIFTPRLVRETRYVEERCRVDGRSASEAGLLAKLVAFLQLAAVVEEFAQLWPTPVPSGRMDPRHAASAAADLASELERFLTSFAGLGSVCFPCVPVVERPALVTPVDRATWLSAIEAETAIRRVGEARKPLSACLLVIRHCIEAGNTHPCLDKLAEAVERRDATKWRVAWELRERLRTEKERVGRYETLLATLDQACPGAGAAVRTAEKGSSGKAQLLQLENAWAWACACTWIRCVSDAHTYRDLVQSAHGLLARIEDKIRDLAALKAWSVFFERLDDATSQNLHAWTKAVDRIVKTGPNVYRRRATARRYLTECIPKIPAWIMPLHRLWDTVEPEPGLFDTVIVDEASQSGIESLALLLLAKRIVVVGDDKQNSPEAVGVLEDDIVRLGREHLSEFRFRDEFRPDTSLFDHAERAFGTPISLREHFRCVPEIIRFSNDLCYRDAPLIPLRQAPPNRLPPLKSVFLREGACEGNGQRIHNRAEAEIVVETIRACIEDDAYDGKSMGVIALQGHAQAELIGSMLAQKVEPKVIEERKLRCGVPATFQGDQRDVIFLSLVMAPNVQHHALSQLPDQRRFNVAMSRARDQVWLFHSIQQHDLSPECLRRRLVNFFQSPGSEALDRLWEDRDRLEREARQRPRRRGTQPEPYESWFEVDVALELLRSNYRVRPQYDLAGYWIDLVIEDLVLNSRLAVECDGDAWHGPEEYERDTARQRQLERAGCTFVRIRESEFYADKAGAVQQIREACEALGIRPADQVREFEHQERARQAGAERVPTSNGAQARTEPDAAETEEVEDSSDAEFGPFTGYSDASGFPDPREASAANIRGALQQIVERDGPLTRASVFQLYVDGCPGPQRATRAVRQALNRALGAMLRSGEIVQDDELGDGSPEEHVVRLAGTPKVRERPAGRRDLLEIPPSELLLVFDHLHPPGGTEEGDDEMLLRPLIEHYGFTRLTSRRKRYLARVLGIRRLERKEVDGSTAAHG